jgi:hypothetical protein
VYKFIAKLIYYKVKNLNRDYSGIFTAHIYIQDYFLPGVTVSDPTPDDTPSPAET